MKLLAKLTSIVGNPLVIGLFFGFYFYFTDKEPQNLKNLPLVFALLIVLPLVSYIIIQVKNGKFDNFDVSNQKQRNSVYRLAIILFSILSLFIHFSGYPSKALLLSLTLLAYLTLSYFLNQKVKVSMHVGVTFLFSWIFYPINPIIAMTLGGFGFFNAWSRLHLKRHSRNEVILGFLLGNVIGGIYLFIFYLLIA